MTKYNNFDFQNFYKKYSNLDSEKLLRIMIKDIFCKKIAVTSSFGAESAVILHLVSRISNNIPVIFLNTEKLFPETLKYLKTLKKKGFGLRAIWRPLHTLKIFKDYPKDNLKNSEDFFKRAINFLCITTC